MEKNKIRRLKWRKNLPAAKQELRLKGPKKELAIASPSKKQKLLAAPKSAIKKVSWLHRTSRYVTEYILSLSALVALAILAAVPALFLSAKFGGSPDVVIARGSMGLLGLASLAVAGVFAITVMRTTGEESIHPMLVDTPRRQQATIRVVYVFATASLGFGLAAIYTFLSPLLSSRSWADAGIAGGIYVALAVFYLYIALMLPRHQDDVKIRSYMELIVIVPFVAVLTIAGITNNARARIVGADQQILADLTVIKQEIGADYASTKKLPATLDDVTQNLSPELRQRAKTAQYRYVAVSDLTARLFGNSRFDVLLGSRGGVVYTLCATFADATSGADRLPVLTTSSPADLIAYQQKNPLSKNSEHPKGNYCYAIQL